MASEEAELESTCRVETERIVTELANDYSQYLHADAPTERSRFEAEVEHLLTRLEEYLGLVDIIHSDTSLCLNRTLPEIQQKSQQMEGVFEKIDKLEAFVALVKRDVQTMEECVNQAETEMGSLSSLKRVLNSISLPSIFKKKTTQPKSVHTTPEFAPPAIFRTEQYLGASTAQHNKDAVRNNCGLPGDLNIPSGDGANCGQDDGNCGQDGANCGQDDAAASGGGSDGGTAAGGAT